MGTGELTKPRFVSQLNGICREAWATIVDNWHGYTRTQSPGLSEHESFEDAVRESLLPGVVFLIFDDIHMTGAPRGDERTIEEMIGPFQVAAELGGKGRWRAHSVAEITPHFAEYNVRARHYGLDDCLVDQAHLAPIEA
jgi:hypothetical protein